MRICIQSNRFAIALFIIASIALFSNIRAQAAEKFKYSTPIPEGIMTPDKVDTSIGRLDFTDGVPSRQTAEKVYDFMDTARAADTFLKGMPAVSLAKLLEGSHSVGAVEAHQVVIFDKLMDSKSLFLTANTSTLYVFPDLDLKRDGPTVVEAPEGLLGAANDGFFRFVENITGGKYLFLPPDYEGEVPEGYTVLRPKTYRLWVLLRKTPKSKKTEDVAEAADFVTQNLRVYKLADAANPPKMEWISVSGKEYNTIHSNDAYLKPPFPLWFEHSAVYSLYQAHCALQTFEICSKSLIVRPVARASAHNNDSKTFTEIIVCCLAASYYQI